MGCHWAHLSLFGAMHHRWIVTGPYSSSLGPLVIVGPSSSSLVTWPVLIIVGGPIRRRHWVVVRAYSLSLECRWALHRVSSSLSCPTLRRWVLVPPCVIHVAMVGVGCSCLIRCASVGRNVGVGHMWSEASKKEKNGKVVVRFHDIPSGPPIAWVPLVFMGSVFLYLLGALSIRLTSLKRGEELLLGWLHAVGRELSWRGRRWWW
jgi:hypothetical protein